MLTLGRELADPQVQNWIATIKQKPVIAQISKYRPTHEWYICLTDEHKSSAQVY